MDEDNENIVPFDKICRIIDNELDIQIKKNKIILDISTFSFLDKIVSNDNNEEITYFIPDTIEKLILKTESNKNYYFYLYKLFNAFSQKAVDLKLLTDIINGVRHDKGKFKFITEEMIDKDIYDYCIQHFSSNELIAEFSPKFNILGDYIGKTLGAAKKLKLSVLMMNESLLSKVQWFIPILYTAEHFHKKKVDFFEKYIPYIKPTRGVRWVLGGLISATQYSQIGWALWALDP